MEEYRKNVEGGKLVCDKEHCSRMMRTREPEQDLEIRPMVGRNVMVSARFFDDVWRAFEEA